MRLPILDSPDSVPSPLDLEPNETRNFFLSIYVVISSSISVYPPALHCKFVSLHAILRLKDGNIKTS